MQQNHQPARRHAPLDPFVVALLGWIEANTTGFALNADGKAAAESLGWPLAFVEVVFTSARMRRLLAPNQPLGRGRVYWTVTLAGATLVAAATAPEQPARTDPVADLVAAAPMPTAENGSAGLF